MSSSSSCGPPEVLAIGLGAQTEDFRGAVGKTEGFVTVNTKGNQNPNLGMCVSKTSTFHRGRKG